MGLILLKSRPSLDTSKDYGVCIWAIVKMSCKRDERRAVMGHTAGGVHVRNMLFLHKTDVSVCMWVCVWENIKKPVFVQNIRFNLLKKVKNLSQPLHEERQVEGNAAVHGAESKAAGAACPSSRSPQAPVLPPATRASFGTVLCACID